MRLLKLGSAKAALGAGLLVLPLLVQAGFRADGPEVAKAGHLRGDQTLPAAAINHQGGIMVWQENGADSSGLGIKAQRLDADMNRSGAAFRVNMLQAGDQEKPQVVLLRNGGAAFAWQGGNAGSQRIYVRFMSANGTFVTSDIRANSFTNGFQVDPAIAMLADGSVVVVWSSFGQESGSQSFQGIYGQRFAPNGAKLGGEFHVNQTTLYNQRSPVVTGLTNGNFVVAWVTELQRGPVSVDVYARVFDASGAPTSPEFPVNLSSVKVCANPSISASLLSGNFAVAWSQDDNQRLAIGSGSTSATVTNSSVRSLRSWDVFARIFGPSGNALSGEIDVNQTSTGDQYAPVVRAFGEDYSVVWTSLGQDGSREGIYGQILNGDGTLQGSEFRVNSTTVSRQIQPVIASDNHSQLLAVWSSFNGDGTGFDLFAQRYASSQVIPLDRITNSIPPVVEPETGLPRLEFPVAAQSNDATPGSIASAAGSYQGIFFSKHGVNPQTSGYLSLKSSTKGSYSGKLQVGAATYAIKGAFDDSGWAASVINRKGSTPLTVYLQLDLNSGNTLRGGVSDGDWWSDVQADRQVFSSTANPSAKAGNYTVVISGGSSGPAGDGFGTVQVSADGSVTFNGTLADGTKVTQRSVVSKDGYWPLYVSLNKGTGVVLGWVEFASTAAGDMTGEIVWSKQADALSPSSPAGFIQSRGITGSRYVAPAAGQKVVGLSVAKLTLSEASLATPQEFGFVLGDNNTVSSDSGLKLTFNAKQGTFKGTASQSSSVVNFQGVVLQKTSKGAGYFLNAGQSGKVRIAAP